MRSLKPFGSVGIDKGMEMLRKLFKEDMIDDVPGSDYKLKWKSPLLIMGAENVLSQTVKKKNSASRKEHAAIITQIPK